MSIKEIDFPETSVNTPIKVFSDISLLQNGKASVGWVFANHNGKPFYTKGKPLGENYDTATEAEVEGIERAIKILIKLNKVRHIKILTDSKSAIYHINKEEYSYRFENMSINWIPREENHIADIVADRHMW